MSYIRCLSNPEGLYITGDVDGVHWYWWEGRDKNRTILLSYRVFEELCHRYDDIPCELDEEPIIVTHKGQVAKLYETWIPDKHYSPDPADKELPESLQWMGEIGKNRLVTVLEVDGIKCPMWTVTWQYILNSCLEKSWRRWWFRRQLWSLHWCFTDLFSVLVEVIHGRKEEKT